MQSIIDEAIIYIKELFEGNAGGHDADHTMRVYRNALAIAKEEKNCDVEAVALAALLHDADDHKLFRTEHNANARHFLGKMNVEEARIDWICEIVNAVSFSQNKGKKPFCKEAEIVQDADRLDAIGAIGIARTFAFGGEHGRELSQTVEHFYEKLLKLKDLMNTEAGRKIAEKRHASMERFLEELESEL